MDFQSIQSAYDSGGLFIPVNIKSDTLNPNCDGFIQQVKDLGLCSNELNGDIIEELKFVKVEFQKDYLEQLKFIERNEFLTHLNLWSETQIIQYMYCLINSPIQLNCNELNELYRLLFKYGLSGERIWPRWENLESVISNLFKSNKIVLASKFINTVVDILKIYQSHKISWVESEFKDPFHSIRGLAPEMIITENKAKKRLAFAFWLNNLTQSVEEICEDMHPNRSKWVKIIRDLKLNKYSKRKGFEKLNKILNVFYNGAYIPKGTILREYELKNNKELIFNFYKNNPLRFCNNLLTLTHKYGTELTFNKFEEIVFDLPFHVVFPTLARAPFYFKSNPHYMYGQQEKRFRLRRPVLRIYDSKEEEILKRVEQLKAKYFKSLFTEVFNQEQFIIDPFFKRLPINLNVTQDEAFQLTKKRRNLIKTKSNKVAKELITFGELLNNSINRSKIIIKRKPSKTPFSFSDNIESQRRFLIFLNLFTG